MAVHALADVLRELIETRYAALAPVISQDPAQAEPAAPLARPRQALLPFRPAAEPAGRPVQTELVAGYRRRRRRAVGAR